MCGRGAAVRVRRELGWRCPASGALSLPLCAALWCHPSGNAPTRNGRSLRSSYLWAKEAEAGERGPSRTTCGAHRCRSLHSLCHVQRAARGKRHFPSRVSYRFLFRVSASARQSRAQCCARDFCKILFRPRACSRREPQRARCPRLLAAASHSRAAWSPAQSPSGQRSSSPTGCCSGSNLCAR